MLFRELNLSDEIKKAVEKIGFSEMTAIQEQAIPIMLTGIDLIGKSQTGTGKTLAFSIPAIEKVKNNIKNGLTVLILCPTRELVTQVHEELKKLTYFLPDIKSTPIYGGVSIEPQILKLKTSNIVIGTPGRVIDHIKRNTLKLQNINLVILDEADEMLDMGFRDDIETILDNTPKEKQVVLFSATMPAEILAVTKKYQKNPKIIEINRKHLAVENIKQIYYNVPLHQKMVALNMLLKYHDPKLVIIFCNTKKCVDELNLYLYKNKFNSKALHGDMNQVQRQKTLDAFKYADSAILIATDVAARGIDISDIDCVINYDIPQNNEYYVHRIGRTGRAGKSGMAVTLCCGFKEVSLLNRISKMIKSNVCEEKFPSAKQVRSVLKEKQIKVLEDSILSLNNENNIFEEEILALKDKGCSLEQIAKGALKLYFKTVSQSDIVDIKVPESVNSDYASSYRGRNSFQNRSKFGNTRTRMNNRSFVKYDHFTINLGKENAGLEPKHILGAITSQSSIDGKDIGRIDIRDTLTVVYVKEEKFKNLLNDLSDNFTIKGFKAVVSSV